MKAIGIGCIWFGSKKSEDAFDDPSEFLTALKTALEKIDTLADLSLPDDAHSILITSPSEDEKERFFPIFSNDVVSFTLYLPDRIQPTYLFGREALCSTDKFHVMIVYKYSLPVMLVSYDLEEQFVDYARESPSDGIVLVREYLKAMLAGNEDVSLEFLGPSPLHVDVFVKSGGALGSEFDFKDLTGRHMGYRTFRFTAPALNDNESFVEFVDKYYDVLGTYYHLVRLGNRLSRQFATAHQYVASLLPDVDSNFVIRKVKSFFSIGSTTEHVLELMLRNQLSVLELQRFISEKRREGNLKEDGPFYPFIRGEIEDDRSIPSDQIRDVVRLYEERRLRMFDTIAMLMSGMLGGAVGTIVTLALSK